MQLSPATLSTITAILSAQAINTSAAQLKALLAPLTDETPAEKYNLQPGEVYILWDEDGRAYLEEYTNRERLISGLQDLAEECSENRRDFDDRISVFIKRCDVPVHSTEKVTVSIG